MLVYGCVKSNTKDKKSLVFDFANLLTFYQQLTMKNCIMLNKTTQHTHIIPIYFVKNKMII